MSPFAFEAKVNHPSLPLDIPNLHILVRKSKDDKNLWCGLCLDLSISAYSRKKTYKKIKEEILSDISKMAINMIQHLYSLLLCLFHVHHRQIMMMWTHPVHHWTGFFRME